MRPGQRALTGGAGLTTRGLLRAESPEGRARRYKPRPAALIDVEPEALSPEDAEAVLFARLEGLLDSGADAVTRPNANGSTAAENSHNKRRTS